jgi:hypothetical protein
MDGMRRWWCWVDFAVCLLAAIVLASAVIAFSKGTLQTEGKALSGHKPLVVVAGILLAGLLLAGAVYRAVENAQAVHGRRYLTFQTEGGQVAISASGVEGVLNRTLRAMDEVADASTHLGLPEGAALPSEIHVRCRLYERPDLLAIEGRMRAAIADRYRDMFPSKEPPPPVQLSIDNIVVEPAPQRSAASGSGPAVDDDQPPFRPRYPVNR